MRPEDYGWCSERDLTHQCSLCFWVLRQHKLACCEFDRREFPHAAHCDKYQREKDAE